MAFTSQVRLAQLTGSLGSGNDITATSTMNAAGSALASVSAGDLAAILQVFGDSLAHIHGKSDFTSQTPGLIEWDNSSVDIKLYQKQTGQKIHLDSDGTTDGTASGGAIHLEAGAGGIAIVAADTKDIWVEGGQAVVTANQDAAGAIKLHADAGSSQTIQIVNDEGTTDGSEGAGAIDIEATVGGISLHAADDKDIWIEAGQTVLTANHDTAEAIKLHADAGASQTIQILNDAGTTDGSEGAGAIDIEATVGGISLHAADDKDIWIEAGQTVLTANHDTAAAIKLHADAGSSQTIQILNDAGTTDGSEGAGAIDIEATLGGISLHAADDKDIWVEAGQTVLTANHDTAAAIKLHADAGTSQTIQLLNDAGTASNAIDLEATAGGFSVDGVQASNITVASAGDEDDLTISVTGANDASLLLSSAGTGADAVSIDATAGSMVIAPSLTDAKTLSIGPAASTQMVFSPHGTAASEKISLVNKAGTADDAIKIDAEAGGVTIAAGNDSLVLDADGTDADALKMDSAGGVDVDAQSHINIKSGNGGSSGNIDLVVGASSGWFAVSGSSGAKFTIDSSKTSCHQAVYMEQSSRLQSQYGSAIDFWMSGSNRLFFGDQYDTGTTPNLTIKKNETIGRFVMSSSAVAAGYEIAFGGTGGNMTNDVIDLGSSSEFSSFVGQSLFNAGTSIIGAFNALADSIDSNYATLYKNSVSSSNAAGVAFGVTKSVGPDSSLSSHNEARARVYLNGQLLSSASSGGQGGHTQNNVSGGDYVVVGNNSTTLRFAFALKEDDLIKVVTVGA